MVEKIVTTAGREMNRPNHLRRCSRDRLVNLNAGATILINRLPMERWWERAHGPLPHDRYRTD